MASSKVDGDLIVNGTLRANNMQLPNNAVGNNQFNSADPLTASKQQHQYLVGLNQAHGTAATAERRAIHCAHAAGTITDVVAGAVVAPVGDSTVTVDVYKNGVSVLSSALTLTSSGAAFEETAGTLSTPAYAAGDVIEVVLTVSAGSGTLPQGVYVRLTLREAAD